MDPGHPADRETPRQPHVAAVVLNWKSTEATLECVAALRGSSGVVLDILVVDNGSTDGGAERLAAELGEDSLLRLGANLGYAGGMNAGLEVLLSRSSADYLMVITPDAVVERMTVARLAGVLEVREEVGIAGPLVVYREEPDPLLSAGGIFEPGRVRAPHLREARSAEPFAVEWIDGCCMVMRREVFESVGGFDERYFLYFEETDFCWRAGRQGWRVLLDPGAVVRHDKTGVPPAHYFYYLSRNRYYFWRKNFGVGTTRVALALASETAGLAAVYLRSLLVPSRRRERSDRRLFLTRQLTGVLAGTRDYLAGRLGPRS